MNSNLFRGNTEIFLDGADPRNMTTLASDPLIAGFTTNPSLMKKAGVSDYAAFCQDTCSKLNGKPVSLEVFADDIEEMRKQAKIIASWEKPGTQIYVKIPVMNTQRENTYALIRDLSQAGIKLNVTAILSVAQARDVCMALKGGAPSIVSVFAGRIADSGRDPLPVMLASKSLCEAAGPQAKLLWASTREPYNIIQADQMGCAIITVPFEMIQKFKAIGKDLEDISLDTVKMFKTDSDAAGLKL